VIIAPQNTVKALKSKTLLQKQLVALRASCAHAASVVTNQLQQIFTCDNDVSKFTVTLVGLCIASYTQSGIVRAYSCTTILVGAAERTRRHGLTSIRLPKNIARSCSNWAANHKAALSSRTFLLVDFVKGKSRARAAFRPKCRRSCKAVFLTAQRLVRGCTMCYTRGVVLASTLHVCQRTWFHRKCRGRRRDGCACWSTSLRARMEIAFPFRTIAPAAHRGAE